MYYATFKTTNKLITYIIEDAVLHRGTPKRSQLQTRSSGQTDTNTSTYHKSANSGESTRKLQNTVNTGLKLASEGYERRSGIQRGP